MHTFFTVWHTKLLKLFILSMFIDFGMTNIGVGLYNGEESNPVFAPYQHDFIPFLLITLLNNLLIVGYIIMIVFLQSAYTKKITTISYYSISIMLIIGTFAHFLGFFSWLPLIFG